MLRDKELSRHKRPPQVGAIGSTIAAGLHRRLRRGAGAASAAPSSRRLSVWMATLLTEVRKQGKVIEALATSDTR